MSTETFLRLPEEKRNRFLGAAWEEFSTVPYSDASINQIVRRAGIPRGSFYQYFTDKADLFAYLMDDIRDQLLEHLRSLIREARGDVFQATVMGYDLFAGRMRENSTWALNRCFSVLRLNSGMDLESILIGRPGERSDPEQYITHELLQELDLTALRRRDAPFVSRMCCLTGMCLGSALMESLTKPEHAARARENLIEELKIIRRGSVLRELAEAEEEGGAAE